MPLFDTRDIMAAILSEGVILKTLKNFLKRVMSVLLIPLLVIGGLPLEINNVFAAEGDDVPPTVVPEDAPVHSKTLTPNGDGTYTIALSVTGSRKSSETTSASKANVILVVDTSNSMNGSSGETSASGQPISRIAAEKDALTKDDGIIDKLLAQNVPGDSVRSDIIEVAVVNFGTEGHTAQTWTTNGTTLKNTINGLTTSTGTNWEGALQIAKNLADAKKQAQPNEDIYVIFLTDGEPTTDETRARNNHNVNMSYGEEWGYASDDARAIVSAGYTFYGLFTWGSSSNSSGYSQTPSAFLKSLVQYAYTGTGTYSSSLSSDYAEYYTDASSTTALINALNQIVHNITTGVGYTDVELEDGITAMTASSVKASASGKVTGLKYYRSGGPYSTTANNGLGEEWADAPEATINANNEVDWDLGDLILENGITYTVTFVVWPKQSSLDLVADLNNGIISYDSLTASQKSQIKHIGDKYALKTNTDFPTLSYSTITTTTVDGVPTSVTSEPTTVEIGNPDPVDLSEAKLALEKKWEDSLDPTQREEVGGEVTLNLLMDGEPYEIKIGDTLTDEILLTETNDWKINPGISVAPGLMVTEDSVAYDPNAPQVSYGGVTYAILEAGHEYTFEEKGINNHFELTSYIHHPMKIGNAVKDVFFSRDADGNITGIEKIENLDTLSATNTLKGGINIEKKVVDQNNKAIDISDSFEITAHLLDAEGNPYSYDYRIYYGKKNPEYESHKVYDAEGNLRFSRSDHIYGEGTLTETLYIGDTIRIVNVDAGVQYYVEETEKNGYASKPTITYEEVYGTEEPGDATEAEEEGYYVVSGNTASSVTVTNKFLDEKTKVDFEKTWYGADGKVLNGKTLPGSITVELFKKGADGKVVSTGKTKKITAENSWKASFTELPKYDNGVEIVYSVKESAIEGATYNDQQDAFFEYDTEENNGQHAVVGRWKVMTLEDYILQNTWTPATESVTGRTSFNIKKVDKSTGKPLEGVTFELKIKDGATFTAITNDKGEATFDDLGAGEYTLKETDALEGYKLITTEPNINITSVKKLNTVDLANLKNFYEYVFSFSTSQVNGYTFDTQNRTFTVENEPIPYIDITAAKVWNDGENRDGLRKNYANYYIAVKNNSGKYVAYEKLVLVDKNDYEFKHLPTKTANNEDITYEIVEASTCSGSGNSIRCTEFTGDDDYTVTVAEGVITNFHEPALYDETGELTVQKIWNGEGNELVRPTTITIELYANGSRLGEPVTISAANEWKHTFRELYLNEGGKPIVYSVQESKLGETAFGEDESVIVILSNDGAVAGSWTKSVDNNKHEVTNTWTKPTEEIEYDGEDEFLIKKYDGDGKALQGVVFTVGDKDYTTDKNGEIKIAVPLTKNKKEESFEYEITEKETLEGYDIVSGSATVAVSCTSVLASANTETLVNTYTKTCEFTKSGSSAYEWSGDSYTLKVMNKRSLAKSLTIKKTVVGLSAKVLSNLEFTITGPEDFGENGQMTLRVSEDCTTAGEVITCKVDGKVPTGQYTVKESNAEVENFTLTITGDDNATKKVTKDAEVEFAITNSYEKIRDVSYSVKKIWEDDGDRDGLRPEKLTVTLQRNGSAYGDPVELTGNDWAYTWKNLPRADEDATLYEYSVVEEEIGDYDSDNGKMEDGIFTFTNTHEPYMYDDSGELTVEKVWTGEGNELVREPVTVMLYGQITNDEGVTETWEEAGPVTLSEVTEWKWTFEGLYKNKSGHEITYIVEETAIGENAFSESSSTLVIYDGERIKGSWTKNEALDHTVTNEWKESTDEVVYEGAKKFNIKKVDENYKAMEGVVFEVNGKEKTTEENGMASKSVPVTADKKEESFEFVIREKETLEGYDLANGSATITVICTSALSGVDTDTLVNTYTKTCTFSDEVGEAFTWDGDSLTLTVLNKRSLAKSFKIEKTVTGVSAKILKDLEFVVRGPEDFAEVTLKVSEDCAVSGDVITCELEGRVPTGKYTVEEKNAEIENFTLNATSDEEITVTKGQDAVFKITNEYEVDKTVYTVVKLWDDEYNNDGKRPGTLTVKLLAGGETVGSKDLSDDYSVAEEDLPEDMAGYDVWMYEFTDLPVADENAEVIEYIAEEVLESDDYEQVWVGGDQYSMTFVNYHEPELIKNDDDDPDNDGQLVVTKVWDDEDNFGNTRPASITVELLADGEVIDTVEIEPDEDGNWEYIFEGLRKYRDGEEIEYTINEIVVENYDTSYEHNGYDYVINNMITDVCLIGGCGGDIIPIITPETGRLTNVGSGVSMDNTFVMIAFTLTGAILMVGGVMFAKRK